MYRNVVRIDLHCHSTYSDGDLSPSSLARHCAERDVRFAALSDHNTIDGQESFEGACERYGIGFISGLELSVLHIGKEIHLLCYGFDPGDEGLVRSLAAIKTLRAGNGSAFIVVPRTSAGELIESVHQAGGIVLLAHPLQTEPDADKLEVMVAELQALGLDGLEAGHSDADAVQQEYLRGLAARYDLVVSAGTDYHGMSGAVTRIMGVDVPVSEWRAFRDRLVSRVKASPKEEVGRGKPVSTAKGYSSGRIRMLIPMVLPALAVIGLSTLTFFGYFLPHFEEALLERKRETIRELTSTVWSMLDEAESQVKAGRLSPDEAKEQAAERIRALRYGREAKDYFWLQDLSPKMIMHPYRHDLEGQNLAAFRDPRGVQIFTVFADKVRRDGSGYVDYVWQWKDDPERLEAKESYIRLFEPWGWVIGTGLYINDVNAEIRVLELRIYHAMLAITVILFLLLLFMLRGGLKSERLRCSAERRLQESNARYASLVRAAAEGVLFVRNRHCVYANPVFLELAGCDAHELPLLNWHELFPRAEMREPTLSGGEVYVDTLLRRRDGTLLECRVALKGMPEHDTGSFVVLVRRREESAMPASPADSTFLKRLLNLPSTAAEDLSREIAAADVPDEVVALCRRTPELVRSMLESGASPIAVAKMISAITDSATSKFIQMVQGELGPEPVPYAFVAVGSQGRQEQTLFTDQDNLIIYDVPAEQKNTQVADYFLMLGKSVCALLTKAGYRECDGQLMAGNAKWCQPLETWRGIFSRWIHRAEGLEAMNFMTLFDLRCVCGEDELVRTLRNHVHQEIAVAPWFFTQAAKNAIQFKTPLRIFGNIVTAGRAKEKTGHLDIKAATMPIVCYARLYALKHQLGCTSTAERISALSDQGVILPSRYHDLLTAFEILLRLRLRHQSEKSRQGDSPDNLIKLSWLGRIDEAVLKECLSEIDRIQAEISKEFLGGEAGNQ